MAEFIAFLVRVGSWGSFAISGLAGLVLILNPADSDLSDGDRTLAIAALIIFAVFGFATYWLANQFDLAIKDREQEEKEKLARMSPRERLLYRKEKLERSKSIFSRGLGMAKEALAKAQADGDGEAAADAQRRINQHERDIERIEKELQEIEFELMQLND
jgi:type IV secretory pathway TrbD component